MDDDKVHPVEISVEILWGGGTKAATLSGRSFELRGKVYPRELKALGEFSDRVKELIRELNVEAS